MNNKPKDITNKKTNYLTAVRFSHMNIFGHACWEYVCDCGKNIIASSNQVNSGCPKSCGCKKNKRTPDKVRASIKTCWLAMKARCLNPKNVNYKNYGARGISFCKEWEDFEVFKDWALKVGFEIGLTIERINVNKDYTPFNCKFIPKSEQSYNKRNCVFIEYNGEIKSIAEWSKITGLHSSLIYSRNKRGYPVDVIFKKPKHTHFKNK